MAYFTNLFDSESRTIKANTGTRKKKTNYVKKKDFEYDVDGADLCLSCKKKTCNGICPDIRKLKKEKNR